MLQCYSSNQQAIIYNLSYSPSLGISAIEHTLHAHQRGITDLNWASSNPEILATCGMYVSLLRSLYNNVQDVRLRQTLTTTITTGTVEYGHSTWEQDDHPFGESLQIHPLLKSNGIERRLILLLQLTILELWFGMIEWDLLPSLQFKLIQPRFMELIGRLSSLYRFVSISILTNNAHVECRMSHDEQQVEKEIWCVIDLFSW